jgi:hypothetical protein
MASAEINRVRGLPQSKNPGFRGAKNQPPNRAFAGLPNRPPGALKNTQKFPFIQELAVRDFALGAWRLSWQK